MVNATKFFVLLPGVPECGSGSRSPPHPLPFGLSAEKEPFSVSKYSSLKILSRKKFRAPAPPERIDSLAKMTATTSPVKPLPFLPNAQRSGTTQGQMPPPDNLPLCRPACLQWPFPSQRAYTSRTIGKVKVWYQFSVLKRHAKFH